MNIMKSRGISINSGLLLTRHRIGVGGLVLMALTIFGARCSSNCPHHPRPIRFASDIIDGYHWFPPCTFAQFITQSYLRRLFSLFSKLKLRSEIL
ncbi:hypothetical protein BDQ12DRAFT_157273 [Crucibulum laeve]|uniref:Uncharacterized protein n=1 Tax=Crucibulum laeve TaxID=68775 RepID=A0A5C3M8A0_9AGAR|nr:hypothetical protein BDQ12DRAFT_157273 [Crucibulum laeve]